MKVLLSLIFGTVLVVLPYVAHGGATRSPDKIQAGVSSAMTKLQRYSSTKSLDDVYSAIYTLQSSLDIGALTPSNFVADRRSLVSGWASILHTVEQAYNPKFDHTQRLGCPVPRNGQLPCSDPKAIEDPAAREKYAQELAAYRVYLNQLYHYVDVRKVDELATASLSAQLNQLRDVAPPNIDSDYAALDQILRKADLSSSRRASIDAMFYAPPIH